MEMEKNMEFENEDVMKGPFLNCLMKHMKLGIMVAKTKEASIETKHEIGKMFRELKDELLSSGVIDEVDEDDADIFVRETIRFISRLYNFGSEKVKKNLDDFLMSYEKGF